MMNEHKALIERIEALVDRDNRPDWQDVVRRAGDAPVKRGRPARSRRSYLARRLVPALALAAAVIAVGLIAPWKGNPSLTERALAAIGDGPVIHAVLQSETGSTYIDLATDQETAQLIRTEIWFDGERHFEHWQTSIDGRPEFDFLETPSGIVNSIGSTPAVGRTPELDPALAGFVDGYRSALESGTAHELGSGTVNGHDVTWIEFALYPLRSDWHETERVAVDASSSLPLRIERFHDGHSEGSSDVVSIETMQAGDGNFTPPQVGPPSYGNKRDRGNPVTPAEAVRALPNAVWTGTGISDLPLFDMSRWTLTAMYKPESGLEPKESNGLEIHYGNGWAYPGAPVSAIPEGTTLDGDFVWLEETATANSIYAAELTPYEVRPPAGSMLFRGCSNAVGFDRRGCTGLMFEDGVYVYVSASSRELLFAAARSLRPIAADLAQPTP